MAPVSMYVKPNFSASSLLTVDLPEPAGPSMAITGPILSDLGFGIRDLGFIFLPAAILQIPKSCNQVLKVFSKNRERMYLCIQYLPPLSRFFEKTFRTWL